MTKLLLLDNTSEKILKDGLLRKIYLRSFRKSESVTMIWEINYFAVSKRFPGSIFDYLIFQAHSLQFSIMHPWLWVRICGCSWLKGQAEAAAFHDILSISGGCQGECKGKAREIKFKPTRSREGPLDLVLRTLRSLRPCDRGLDQQVLRTDTFPRISLPCV